jgi:hypothetical protein
MPHSGTLAMAQHGFVQFGSGPNGGNIDPNDLMGSGYPPNFNANNNNNNYNANPGSSGNGFSRGGAGFDDDELLEGLASPTESAGLNNDFVNMGFAQGGFQQHRGSLHLDPTQINGLSATPDGDPIQSPYAAGFNAHFRQMPNAQSLGTSLHSPLSYSGSPLAAGDMNGDGNNQGYLNTKRMSQQMQRKSSNNGAPMTPKSNTMHGMSIGSHGSAHFSGQKSPNGQWMNTPAASIPASYNSGFSSPMQQGINQINQVMMEGGRSMPTKLNVDAHPNASQEAKRKRRRESHNLVERRRRDNINERIQDLSRLVPTHRLEDDKIRKLIQNGTPLSPTLTGLSTPSQATSSLAGPGARRAAGTSTGNITTGLPIDDKDKGPNKGDILNGAVSWTRDLMWLLHLKLQQQEELMNIIAEMGGHFPFEHTDDERRMQSELMDAIGKNDTGAFTYSRTAGSGLRVPHHTDYRGDTVSGSNSGSLGPNLDTVGITPEGSSGSAHGGGLAGDMIDPAQFWNDPDEDSRADAVLNFKEEDEYGMDLTQ